MGHAAEADELLEVPGDELRPVVREDPGPGVGVTFAGPLDDRLDIGLGHGLPDLPVDDEPAYPSSRLRYPGKTFPRKPRYCWRIRTDPRGPVKGPSQEAPRFPRFQPGGGSQEFANSISNGTGNWNRTVIRRVFPRLLG